MRNLSTIEAKNTIFIAFKKAIDKLTIHDKGTVEVKNYIKLSNTKPMVFNNQEYLQSPKTLFNKIIGDSRFELEFTSFLDRCSDEIKSFTKNYFNIGFHIEYQGTDGNIHDYYPDFIVKKDIQTTYIIELKGIEDLDVPNKTARLIQWCHDVNEVQNNYIFIPLYIKQEEWNKHKEGIKAFQDVIYLFSIGEVNSNE